MIRLLKINFYSRETNINDIYQNSLENSNKIITDAPLLISSNHENNNQFKSVINPISSINDIQTLSNRTRRYQNSIIEKGIFFHHQNSRD